MKFPRHLADLWRTIKGWVGVLTSWLMRLRQWFDLGRVWTWMKKSTAVMRRNKAPAPEFGAENWKRQALNDFAAWLEEAPEPPEGQKLPPDACDLFAMMTEFIALRQEIRLQNREQHSLIRAQQAVGTHLQTTSQLMERLTAGLEKLQAERVEEARINSVTPFLEVRDALVRGLAAARRVSRRKRWYRRTPKGVDVIAQGYAMALRRFDQALAQVDVIPIQAEGQPFDAVLMQAVARDEDPDQPSGTVLAEQAGGFMHGGRVLRSAQVIVNK